MRAGPLRNLILIQRPTVAKDDRGQDVTTWSDFARVYSDIHQMSAKEREAAMQVAVEATWKATVRFTPGLTIANTDRVVYGARTLDIVEVRDVGERHRMIELLLKEHRP